MCVLLFAAWPERVTTLNAELASLNAATSLSAYRAMASAALELPSAASPWMEARGNAVRVFLLFALGLSFMIVDPCVPGGCVLLLEALLAAILTCDAMASAAGELARVRSAAASLSPSAASPSKAARGNAVRVFLLLPGIATTLN